MRFALCLALLAATVLSTDQSAVGLGEAEQSAEPLAKADQTAAAPQSPEKPQIFRAGVELVSLNVTVTDSQGRYVTDLEQTDFSVFEDGAKQELSFFNRSNLPIALSLLVDSSASMEQRMEHAQEAAIGFAKRIRSQDLAQIVDFDSRVEIKHGFTNNVADLEAAILKSQHRVVYARPQTLIPPEKIDVSAAKPGVVATGGPARGQALR